ncbi:MAG: flippase [Candidatus Omnitrophota bacterium]
MLMKSSGFRKYLHNTGYLFFEKICRGLITFLIWAQVIRYLGPEQFGVFSYALSFVFLFNILSDLGLESIVVRDLIRHGKEKTQILGAAFFLKLIGSFAAVILIFIVVHTGFIEPDFKGVIIAMSLRLFFQSLDVIDYYFQSRVLSKFTVYAQLISLSVTSFLCLSFVYLGKPLVYFIYVVIIEMFINAIGLLVFYALNGQKIFVWRFRWDVAKRLLKEGWPLIISGLAISIFMRIDQIMIKQMLSVTSVGYYSAAVRISEAFYFVPIALTSSLFPAIVNAKLMNKELYQNRLKALFSLLFWLALGISTLVTIIAWPVINIFYGPAYLPAAQVLAIHIWALVFVFWSVARTKWAINESLQVYTMTYTIIASATNIVLNIILIPRFDINGAAIAAVISQLVVGVLSNLLFKKTREVFFLQIRSLNFMGLLRKTPHLIMGIGTNPPDRKT